MLMTALLSTSQQVIFSVKEFDNCSLFRSLVLTPTAENPPSKMYEDVKGSSTFKISAELDMFVEQTAGTETIFYG
jgi:hypothetical protein